MRMQDPSVEPSAVTSTPGDNLIHITGGNPKVFVVGLVAMLIAGIVLAIYYEATDPGRRRKG